MPGLSSINYNGANRTDRGTKIVKPGEEMDKNAFLTILAAELANQDPTADIDSTAYVSQLAQFASMEQMSNLNTTMSNYANQNLIGKGVTVSITDDSGMPYTGVVQSVTNTASGTNISLELNVNGKNEVMTFPIDKIVSVVNVPDYSIPPLTSLQGNMQFLVATSFINKNVELTTTNAEGKKEDLSGLVKGVYKDSNGNIMLRVELESGEIKEFNYSDVTKVGDFSSTETEDGNEKE